jgi:hypothetical protein
LEAKTAAGAAESLPEAAGSECNATPRLTRQYIQGMWGRASQSERGRLFTASREGTTALEFDAESRLTLEDRAQILANWHR